MKKAFKKRVSIYPQHFGVTTCTHRVPLILFFYREFPIFDEHYGAGHPEKCITLS